MKELLLWSHYFCVFSVATILCRLHQVHSPAKAKTQTFLWLNASSLSALRVQDGLVDDV